MRPVEDLKIRPFRHLKPAATANDIRELEQAFGVSFPAAYSQFLQLQNGGRPKLREIEHNEGRVIDLEMMYGVGFREADERAVAEDPNAWDYCNLWGELRVRRQHLPLGAIPIRRDGSGSVFYTEDDRAGLRPVGVLLSAIFEHRHLAESFEALLDKLRLPQ